MPQFSSSCAELAGVGAHGGLDRQHVAHQAEVLDVFVEQSESVAAIHVALFARIEKMIRWGKDYHNSAKKNVLDADGTC